MPLDLKNADECFDRKNNCHHENIELIYLGSMSAICVCGYRAE